MSEIKIQTTPAPEAGAQEPLQVERRGNEGLRQNQMADCIGRGSEILASSQPIETRIHKGVVNGVGQSVDSCTSSGKAVAGVAVNVTPVDRKTVEGSYPGDSRKRGADAQLPNMPGPREPRGQAQT